jgi:rhamnosyltransferase
MPQNSNQTNLTIGIAVITHNAKHYLPHCLPPFLKSPLKPRVLVVNSSSQDGTVETAQKMGVETLIIPRIAFNHGSTREKARRHLQTDIVVMTTPDAYALNEHVLEKLVAPIFNGKVAVSYARQIPHENADFFERFPREFNYPSEGHIRSLDDINKFGIYTFFCSNSCAAYLNSALEEIGGFQSVLIGEDTVAAAHLLRKGHRISYTAEAIVRHSHRYTLRQEFYRSFDTGLARTQYRHLIALGGKDTTRGKQYVKEMLKGLASQKPSLIPYAIIQTLAKWTGYRLGQACIRAPVWLKKCFSGQDFYWEKD